MIMLAWLGILAVLFAEGAWMNILANRERDARQARQIRSASARTAGEERKA